MHTHVPGSRVSVLNDAEVDPSGQYVLYWMTSHRRTTHNYALQRAADWSRHVGRGLLVLEALRCDYEWASERHHRFVLDGMVDNAAAMEGRPGITYYPYVEGSIGEGKGLLESLAESAAVVVTDDYPTFFVPRMLAAVSHRLETRLEAVDSNGLVPMRSTDRVYPTAYTFRRYLQKALPAQLELAPLEDPAGNLAGLEQPTVPGPILARWPSAEAALASGGPDLTSLPLDHSVPSTQLRGGERAASERLDGFLKQALGRYDDRNQPDEDVASGLSPYLHFGHISTHAILARLAAHEDWTPNFEGRPTNGKRTGWWGMSSPAEAFLDQFVTWRELGFNMAALRSDHREYESLPEWARNTLTEHASDPRPYLYSLEQLDSASTHDELWNAAQRQLRREGVIHNYLRMLWGKKILKWTATPREAARLMIELNNRYALDGRDPNSYSGIYWCLGRYDRPWGPERPVFGKIRYMTSANTARKLRVREYMERFAR
ncbi:MAG: deoxyribodipyrimidine photolyase [marine benthic group bacterium]|nr:deoxyribodipyrimidine photolyase [Gemmatimonadota bacterium]